VLSRFVTRILPQHRALSLKPKLLIPIIGLMLLSLLGSTLAFLGGTAFTRNQLLRREVSADAQRVIGALHDRVTDVDTSSRLLAEDPALVRAVREDTEAGLSTMNSRAVVVRDRFGLDLIQIYGEQGQARVNLMLSNLYRESLLLDRVTPGVPDLYVVHDRVLLLSQAPMPEGEGTVVTGIDLETELSRTASAYRLASDLALQVDGVSTGTRQALTHSVQRGGGDYVTSSAVKLGQTKASLILVRPTGSVKKVTTTGLVIMVVSTLVTTLLLIALGVMLAGAIAHPIEKLSAAARSVAVGELSQVVEMPNADSPLSIGCGDEIGLLTRTFNSMVADLYSLYEDLEYEVNARTKELKTAADVARVVSSTLAMDSILRKSLALIEERIGLSHTQAYLIDPPSGSLRLRAATSSGGQRLLEKGFEVPLGSQSLVAAAAASGGAQIAQDVTSDPRFLETPQLLVTGSAAAIPLEVGQRIIGVLYVQCAETDHLTHEIVDLLHTLADQMAMGLHNAQLYEELEGYAQDLEARVEERAAVVQAQYAQLQAVLNSTADGIIVTGGEGAFILANRVAEMWLDQSLSPEESRRLREAVGELAEQADDRAERILELTGLDLQLRAAPVSGSGGERARAVVAIHDVSHLKALDRMKSRFVSNVSHELRTPIATIKLLAHLMQKQPEQWREYIGSLMEEANYQAQLVEDILEMSRVDAGRIDLEPQMTPLGQLAEDAVERHAPDARRRGLVLTCQPCEDSPAWVDRQRMMQVMNNLISNAIRYTPEGGQITVSTDRLEQNGRRWARATVIDTGMGIPEDELPYIFDRFFRGEKPRSMQISGTGLGLAIVQEIVQLHGGRVMVESEVNEGSTFAVLVPAAARRRIPGGASHAQIQLPDDGREAVA